MPVESQLMVKSESTYGTAVTVDKGVEFNEEDLQYDYGRLDATGMRAGARGKRSDRRVPFPNGGGGTIKLYPLSKGFGWWLQHLIGGSIVTTGPTDSAYTHTAAIAAAGRLTGKSFTAQVNRQDNTLTDRVFTFEGGKIVKWGLAVDALGFLELTVETDFEDVKTATGKAVASYPSGTVEPFSFQGCTVTYGGATIELKKFAVECTDQGLRTDGKVIRGTALKKEPVEQKVPEFKWSGDLELPDLAQWNYYASTTPSGTGAQVVATFVAQQLIGVSALPTITVTIPFAGMDEFKGGTKSGLNTVTVGGEVDFDGTNAPVTLAYKTLDATPL